MRGHNICFHGEIRKKYIRIILYSPSYLELCYFYGKEFALRAVRIDHHENGGNSKNDFLAFLRKIGSTFTGKNLLF